MAKTLLVVDQNLSVHRLLDFTLRKEGFRIIAVEDGLAALDRAYQDSPALIMVNSQLDGLPLNMFVRKVREREALRTTPIILMAQSSDDLNLDQLHRSGITDVVKKPLDAMEINATINRCILPGSLMATGNGEPAGDAGMNGTTPASFSSTEDDQDMMEMEQSLGWLPREKTADSAPAPAPPPPSIAPAPPAEASAPPQAPPTPKPTVPVSAADAHLEFELYNPMDNAGVATPEEIAASQNNGVSPQSNTPSMDDLLTGSDALFYQQPVVETPPPPSEPEPKAESELPEELQELMSVQAPIPVNAPEWTAPPPPVSSSLQSPSPGSGGLTEMTREETERLVRSIVEEMTRKVAQETVERVTNELVPELTERAVRAEIDRLKAE
jgi:CheY-like chemotaxis protein